MMVLFFNIDTLHDTKDEQFKVLNETLSKLNENNPCGIDESFVLFSLHNQISFLVISVKLK